MINCTQTIHYFESHAQSRLNWKDFGDTQLLRAS